MKSRTKIEFIDVETGKVILTTEDIKIVDISYKDMVKKLNEKHKK